MSYGVVERKLSASNLFDCSDISGFMSSIVDVIPFKGSSMSRLYICEYDSVRFLTKLCLYRKTLHEIYGKPSKNVIPPVDAEINILQILKEKLIDHNLTPCILELVYARVCEGIAKIAPREEICEQMVTEYSHFVSENDVENLLCHYHDLVKNNFAHDKCAFLVLDKCDMNLDEYLRKSINTPVSLAVFKTILFQIIYTFYIITKIYPGFRHFDLHTDNIMLKFDPNYKFQATNPKFLIFDISGEKYSVPYFGMIPKIIDFGFSMIPEENIRSNAVEDRVQMYSRSQNDLLFLFHWIYYTLSHSGGDKLGRVDKILQHLEPNRTYVQYYTEYIRKIEKDIPSYEQMVKNPIWNEYKKYKAPKNQIYNEFSSFEEVYQK